MLTPIPSHRDELGRDGYRVVSGLSPAHPLQAARDVISAFVNAELDEPQPWYRHAPLDWSIVPIHQAQGVEAARQERRLLGVEPWP